jgi:hypothetical protein
MLTLYRYVRATHRLNVYQEIVDSLGGENEAPVNTLVNRDIAKKEVEFYSNNFWVWLFLKMRG